MLLIVGTINYNQSRYYKNHHLQIASFHPRLVVIFVAIQIPICSHGKWWQHPYKKSITVMNIPFPYVHNGAPLEFHHSTVHLENVTKVHWSSSCW